jgi:hypothetical protein
MRYFLKLIFWFYDEGVKDKGSASMCVHISLQFRTQITRDRRWLYCIHFAKQTLGLPLLLIKCDVINKIKKEAKIDFRMQIYLNNLLRTTAFRPRVCVPCTFVCSLSLCRWIGGEIEVVASDSLCHKIKKFVPPERLPKITRRRERARERAHIFKI